MFPDSGSGRNAAELCRHLRCFVPAATQEHRGRRGAGIEDETTLFDALRRSAIPTLSLTIFNEVGSLVKLAGEAPCVTKCFTQRVALDRVIRPGSGHPKMTNDAHNVPSLPATRLMAFVWGQPMGRGCGIDKVPRHPAHCETGGGRRAVRKARCHAPTRPALAGRDKQRHYSFCALCGTPRPNGNHKEPCRRGE